MKPNKSGITPALVIALLISLPIAAHSAGQMAELNDAQLDLVVAGAASVVTADELASFSATKTTASGLQIAAEGSFSLADSIDRAAFGNLILSDGAQGNLSALVNVNAVNSVVNVLLNLNININSTVGSLNQFNLSGALPIRP